MLLDKNGLGDHRANATRTQEPGKSSHDMDNKDNEIAHLSILARTTKPSASSTGRCNTSVKSFCRSFKLQRLTGPFVQLTCHLVQMRLRVHRQVRSLGEVLSE